MCVTTGADNLKAEEEVEASLVHLDANAMSLNSPGDGNLSGFSSVDDEEDEGQKRCKAPGGGDGFKKFKMMCSYGGRILPRRDGQLGYVGGETRILVVNKEVRFSSLMDKLARMVGRPKKSFVLKYQLPEEDLDALVSVSTDEDVVNMMDEYYKAALSKSSTESKLRAFLFFLPSADSGSPGPLKDSSSLVKPSSPKYASLLQHRRPFYENDARCQLRRYFEHHQRFKRRQQHEPMDPAQPEYYTYQKHQDPAQAQFYTQQKHRDPAAPSVNLHGYYSSKLHHDQPLSPPAYYPRHHHFQEGMITAHHHGYYEPAQHQLKYPPDASSPLYHHRCRC